MSERVAITIVGVLVLLMLVVGVLGWRAVSRRDMKRIATLCFIFSALAAAVWLVAQVQIAHYASR